MNSNAKNMTNYLVESETLPMFALPKSDECITDTYFKNAHKSVSLCSNLFCRLSLFGEKRGYALFCLYTTKLFNTKCQRVKKLVSNWGIIVSSPRNPFASTVNYSVISVPCRQCARLTNRNYPTKPTKYRYARLLRRRLTVLKKTLNLQTYTRLRTRYMRSAGLWRILTLVSSTYRSILNQLESLFDREPLLMPI